MASLSRSSRTASAPTGALHPTPHTLHPALYTLHPRPCTLHPTPHTLHPTPHTLHPAPCTLHPAPCTLHPAPCTLHLTTHTPGPFISGGPNQGSESRLRVPVGALAVRELRDRDAIVRRQLAQDGVRFEPPARQRLRRPEISPKVNSPTKLSTCDQKHF